MNIQKSVMWMKDLKEYCNDVFRPIDKETADYIIAALEELDGRRLADELKPEPTRNGKWVPVPPENKRGGYECNLCRAYSPAYRSGDDYLSRYCPYCGAKMEKD